MVLSIAGVFNEQHATGVTEKLLLAQEYIPFPLASASVPLGGKWALHCSFFRF